MQTEWLGDSVSESETPCWPETEKAPGRGSMNGEREGRAWWEHVSHTEIVNYSFVHAGSLATSSQQAN